MVSVSLSCPPLNKFLTDWYWSVARGLGTPGLAQVGFSSAVNTLSTLIWPRDLFSKLQYFLLDVELLGGKKIWIFRLLIILFPVVFFLDLMIFNSYSLPILLIK